MRAVNLLPRETTGGQFAADRTLLGAVAFTLVVIAAVAGGYFIEKAHASTERQHLALVQSALAQAQSRQSKNTSPHAQLQVPVVLSQQEPWHVALDAALSSRVAWDVLLRQLEYAVPDNVSLTTVTIGATGSAGGAASGAISIAGNAFSEGAVAAFLATLARVPKLTQPTLVSTTTNAGSSVTGFQITAQMALPVALTPPTLNTTATTTTTGG